MPTKAQIVEHWAEWLDMQGHDYGEPFCWACGRPWLNKDSKYDSEASLSEIFKRWDTVKALERCHIVAKQFGGSDSVDNLFLMCKECHVKSPDTTSRELFFKWVDAQCWLTDTFATIEKEIITFGLENRVDEISELLFNKRTNPPQVIKDNLGSHFNKIHGNKVSMSTFIAAIAIYLDDKGRS